MEEIIKTFHIDYKLILAQLVNFVIVLLVFKRYAYKPLLKMLNDRSEKIEKGLKEAKEAGEKLLEAEDEKKAIVSQARVDAQEIIIKAEESANRLKEEIIAESKNNAQRIVEQASASIAQEKSKILSEIKDEISDLVVLGMEKILQEEGKRNEFGKDAIGKLK